MPKRPHPTPQTAPPSAAIYVRVSTEEQAKSGYGLDVQQERCAAMAVAKGWTVDAAHVYADEGISGTKLASERPGLAALLAAVAAGQIHAVIVLALDRLGRKTTIILDLVEQIIAAGVEVVSCKEALDTTTATGRFVLSLFAALAQLERDNIVERTTSGRNARGKKDGEKGGRVPYGYVRAAGGILIDSVAAAVVRRIFGMNKRGTSLRHIAAELNAADIATPKGGSLWYPATVAVILNNKASYTGGTRGASEERWPAILEPSSRSIPSFA